MCLRVFLLFIIKNISSELIENWKSFENWNPEISAT